jgi:hypothetical protein
LLQLLAHTLLRREPWRALARTSCLSVGGTVLVVGLSAWLFGLIPPPARLSLLPVGSLHTFVITCSAAWTLQTTPLLTANDQFVVHAANETKFQSEAPSTPPISSLIQSRM